MYQLRLHKFLETQNMYKHNKMKTIKNGSELQDANAVIIIKKRKNYILSKLYPYYYLRYVSILLEYINVHEIKSFLDEINKQNSKIGHKKNNFDILYALIC
ncbi:unnamed protein product [Paramecium pentaurelia]|uniref:Uncharacterized protein n=1 Tax=Paramecium pentaurelia TaxID=43138 RepID=A0A8S1T817_9CILI|nr:unnamed protein product [Paramecium pentaurelia]